MKPVPDLMHYCFHFVPPICVIKRVLVTARHTRPFTRRHITSACVNSEFPRDHTAIISGHARPTAPASRNVSM